MAHKEREHYLPDIFKSLGFECPVSWDINGNRWDTGARAWRMYDPESSHHLVLQDDAIVPQGLLSAIERAVEKVPDKPISLFYRNKERYDLNMMADAAHKQGCSWVVLNRLNWGVAILLPVKHIDPMLKWVENNCYINNYDLRIALYYLHKNMPVYYTLPSLVDHRTDGTSITDPAFRIPGSQRHRYARYFIGDSAASYSPSGDIYYETARSLNFYYRKLLRKNQRAKLAINT